MNEYTHILVALDLSNESEQVLQRALALSRANQSRLSLLHVIEPLGYAYGGDIPMDLTEVQQHLEQHARTQLKGFGEKANIAESDQYVLIGRPESEVHRFAEEHKVDLIVVGSHGRHGLQLLLGSTANAVLHGAQCDVLAVRIHDQPKD